MNQPLDPRNAIRRVATAHLLFLGDLNRYKAKFLTAASSQRQQQASESTEAMVVKKTLE